ncbi:O-acetylhomoserine aminocarboxypropyltransferase/cysteine synthase family protein [Ottowia sp.]|uniref:O-acetylhomoserine aminocarboxypropyltransferase/cysteine synthase family protein n=1 Tax=Ottowia sp. TaxID=1898956 RepID=UPI001DD61A52|nr:O-acetylhomoserine aminocarboxypropyltransferase/cysteine synthase family protein [Ottowia sp.]MCB2023819.1 O-acetylhomoserine aminocarboxypropyltransferase/cysteine synthase [Ottowia sp.]MCP5256692.1 O-acetylhomoserine aminocarboxypropyltransferase/cysteine synthase [Burkholderiaceae bacterium]HRW73031.1 O-acetylhomoserine aminocarboxypropyltransferase/cysteine synthase [Ottowia sp.]
MTHNNDETPPAGGDHVFGFGTRAIHAAAVPDPVTGARATPIHQSTSFVFDNADHAAALFNLQTFGNVYSRIGNPTVAVFEERMASLENGRAALACASGMAAQMTALLAILKAGDHIVAASTLYGGSVGQLGVGFARLGIETSFVDPSHPNHFAAAMRPNTRAVYGETIGNPLVNVLDIAAVAEVAHAHGVPLVIDNTVASPYLCNPCDLGADIVVHSATKYIGGHGTTMGGVVVESGKFPWDNGKFPEMVEPSRAYHGVKFYETFGDFGYTMKARMEVNRTFGAVLSPLSAWLLLQGSETLHLRMREHCRNARRVADFLRQHPRVAWVNYPGLPDSPYFGLASRQFRAVDGLPGASGILTFGVKGGAAAGERFIDACEFLSHLANIGDAKTLVIHPASTTHRQLNDEELQKAGVSADMVRLSVGIEDADDILWDIDQALARAAA